MKLSQIIKTVIDIIVVTFEGEKLPEPQNLEKGKRKSFLSFVAEKEELSQGKDIAGKRDGFFSIIFEKEELPPPEKIVGGKKAGFLSMLFEKEELPPPAEEGEPQEKTGFFALLFESENLNQK